MRIIKNSLERDSLFTTLDEQQIRAFIQVRLRFAAAAADNTSSRGSRFVAIDCVVLRLWHANPRVVLATPRDRPPAP